MTVVIPCFKQAHWLPDAIDSALAQTYPNVEVLVVNDGSPDDTSAVARTCGERVRLIEQPNTGLSGARNAGILEGRGELIAILDSDDALHPDCLARRVAMLLADPQAGMVTGNVRFVDVELRDTGREGMRKAGDPPDPQFRTLVRGNWGATCGTILRRTALERCGLYDPFLRACEDWDAQIRISKRYRVLYDSEPGADVREAPGSMSRGHTTMWDMAVAVMRKNRALADDPWHYWIDSKHALFNNLLMMMNRVRSEESGGGKWRSMLGFAWKRPASVPYFMAWGVRFVLNQLRKVLGLKFGERGGECPDGEVP